MSTCIEKLPHKDCGSSDALQTFFNEQTETYTGYCFSCETWIADPYGDDSGRTPPKKKKKTKEEIEEEVQFIKTFQVPHKPIRSIPKSNFVQWGLRVGLSEYDGKTPFALYFGYQNSNGNVVGWKARAFMNKSFWTVGDFDDVDPFGFARALRVGGKKLYITEGEFDAIALEYAIRTYSKDPRYHMKPVAVISLSSGVSSVSKDLKNIRSRIKNKFDEIVLCFDDDEAGKQAEKKAQALYPDVLRMDKPYGCKDANEALIKGEKDQLAINALFKTHKPPIQGIIKVEDVINRALEKPQLGLSYPFKEFDEMTLGQRMGELVSVGGGVGTGKTLLAHEWAAHNIIEHKIPCFMVLLEEQNHVSLRNVAGKIDSIPYHVPETQYDEEQFIETAMSLKDMLFMWESDADQSLRFELEEIINAIRFNTEEYGCKFHYIDNMTRLVDHLTATEANEFINKYSSVLEGLCTQLDINITVFSHLNNTGKISHEEGGRVLASQFTGSRGLMRSSPMMIGFERNKLAEGDRRNNSYLTVIKNRKYGFEGRVKTKYNTSTGRLKESEWEGDSLYEGDGDNSWNNRDKY